MNKKVDKKQELESKRGLAFVPFHKIRMTRTGTVLVYLNQGSAISININYLRKVLENQGEG